MVVVRLDSVVVDVVHVALVVVGLDEEVGRLDSVVVGLELVVDGLEPDVGGQTGVTNSVEFGAFVGKSMGAEFWVLEVGRDGFFKSRFGQHFRLSVLHVDFSR